MNCFLGKFLLNYMMLGIGDKFPQFNLTAVKSGKNDNIGDAFYQVSNDSFKGKWMIVFFWPKDFTFVCPTEIVEFAKLNSEFAARNAVVLGASVDSDFVHLAWKKSDANLTDLSIPMLSDVKRELSISLGILDKDAGVSQRACYIVNPEGVIKFVYVTDLKVGRNPAEVLRVFDALETGELCPSNWKKGEKTIQVK